jgi:putative peptidoglycan lipid II flippase
VSVLFQRGAFSADEAWKTAVALTAFAIGLWPVAVLRVVVPTFYALQDTRTPVWTAAAAFLTNVLFSLSLMGPVEAGESSVLHALAVLTSYLHVADLRHAGLALATSLAAAVNLGLLVILLRRKLGPLGLTRLLPHCTRDVLASTALAVPVWWLQARLTWSGAEPLWWRAGWLGVCVMAGVVTFALAHTALGGGETRRMWELVRERVSGEPQRTPA